MIKKLLQKIKILNVWLKLYALSLIYLAVISILEPHLFLQLSQKVYFWCLVLSPFYVSELLYHLTYTCIKAVMQAIQDSKK